MGKLSKNRKINQVTGHEKVSEAKNLTKIVVE